jgi:hypothetical protein
MSAEMMIPEIDREMARIRALLTEAPRLPHGMVTEFRMKADRLDQLRALYEFDSFPDEAL